MRGRSLWVALRSIYPTRPAAKYRSGHRNVRKIRIAMISVLIMDATTAWASSNRPTTYFNFHDYDGITDKQEKISSASKDFKSQFPIGSPVQNIRDYFDSKDGYCQNRNYIPPQDRVTIQGDHIYCALNYPMPGHIFFVYHWSVDIEYDKKSDTVEALNVFWELQGIGG